MIKEYIKKNDNNNKRIQLDIIHYYLKEGDIINQFMTLSIEKIIHNFNYVNMIIRKTFVVIFIPKWEEPA